ncbi:MAG: helix-turn-helix domain-containing protein [Burkholderiales bacterium]|nr:MAG: helix-turn-helix domain-containing protein [Burkholderiales bacterium]
MSNPDQADPQPDAAGETPAAEPLAALPDGAAAIAGPAQLVAAREARGWSVPDLASKLGMASKQIEALERGDWDALPGRAFVRGAIRAYGKALQADVGPLLASVGGSLPAAELRPAASLQAPIPRRGALGFDNGGSGSRLTWILLGLLGVIAIAMYFGRGGEWSPALLDGAGGPSLAGRSVETVPVLPTTGMTSGPKTSPADSPSVAPQSSPGSPLASQASAPTPLAPSPSATAADGAAASDQRAPGPASADAARSSSPSAAPADAARPLPGATTAPASATATATSANAAATLRFRFERESWVEVRDAGGKLILHGLQPADSVREVAGRRPYTLVVGNAQHVRLEHDGREVDLGAIERRGVARLKID